MGNQQPNGLPVQVSTEREALPEVFRVILLGADAVGKSTLLWRLRNPQQSWAEKGIIIATIGIDFQVNLMKVDDTTIKLQIWDTAGHYKFNGITFSYLRKDIPMRAAVVIYDVTRKSTFETAKEWVNHVQELCQHDIVVGLIGNKADCPNWAISSDTVKAYARERGILLHGEVSAKTGLKVVKLFTEITRAIIAVKFYKTIHTTLPETKGVFPSCFVQMDNNLKITPVDSKSTTQTGEIPLEILLEGPGALAAYQSASQAGTQKIHRTRLMLVGQERVGKTSLMNTLTGQKYKSSESITDSLDVTKVCKVPFFNPGASWVVEDANKKEHAQHLHEKYKKGLASVMAQELLELGVAVHSEEEIKEEEEERVVEEQEEKEEEEEGESSASLMNEQDEVSIQTESEDLVTQPLGNDEPVINKDSFTESSPGPVTSLDMPIDGSTEEMQVPSDIANALDEYQKKLFTDKEVDNLEIAFWDFAGQELYYTTHQVFLNRRAVFVLVFNMSQNLLEHCQVGDFSVSQKRTKKTPSRFNELNGVEFINFWLQSIYTYVAATSEEEHTDSRPYRSPPIFIIGTHRGVNRKKDQAARQDEDSVKQQIFDIIAGKPYEMNIIRQIHFIENNPKLRTKEDQEAIQALKEQIAEVAMNEPYMKDNFPIRWLQFQRAVVEAAANKKHYMTLMEAKQLGATFKIQDDQEFMTMLQLYHDLGTIIYFGGNRTKQEESLKDIVILDPQWLIDVFKRIITVLPEEKQWATYSGMWRRLQDEGILEDALIDHVWKELLHLKAQLLDLMKMFDLLFSGPTDGGEHKPIYYVPGCLKPPTTQANQTPQDITDGTFYVNCGEFLPDGIFHRVLVHTARWTWRNTGKSPKLFYRFGLFTIGPEDNIHTCQLQMRTSKPACIKVAIKSPPVFGATSENKPSIELCTEVLRFIEETMSDVKCKWAKGFQYEVSVCCLACRDRQGACRDAESELHLIPLTECYKECVYCEHTDQQIPTKLYWEQLQPPNEEIEPASDITTSEREGIQKDEVSESDFSDAIRLLGPSQLQHLYSELDIPYRDIEKAEEGASTKDVNLKARAVLRFWKQVKGQRATRSAILDALQECKFIDAKEKLEGVWSEKYPANV